MVNNMKKIVIAIAVLPMMAYADRFMHHAYVNSYVNDKCSNKYNTVGFHKQAVGVLNRPGENAKFKFEVPKGSHLAYFIAKSHAPRPSMEFSKKNYYSICWSGKNCKSNEISIRVCGKGCDTLAPVNKSFVQKRLDLDGTEKYLYVYWANTGRNFGTSSMFDADIIFKLTDVECNKRKEI